MINGIVNADFEPIIALSVCSSSGQAYTQDAIIDTGFNGWLSLSPDLITELGITWKRRGQAVLGDGSECIFNVYEAVVVWDGISLLIPIDEADSEPLIGMSLMEGYLLTIEAIEGGQVELNKLETVLL